MKNINYKEITDLNKIINTGILNEKPTTREPVSKYLSVKETHTDDIYEKWLNYVCSNKNSEIYNHPLWVKALEKEYNRKAVILYCEDEKSKIRGILPLLPTRGIPFKKNEPIAAKRLASLPRTPLGGFLFDNDQIGRLLIESAIEKTKINHRTLLQLKSYNDNLNNEIEGLYKVPWRTAYYVKLSKFPESIRFGSKKQHYNRRKDVAKAKKMGITIRKAETETDLKNWYKLYCETMRWHAVPVRSFRFFKFLKDSLEPENLFTLLLAESKDGKVSVLHAGSIFLKFNESISYSFNGRKESALVTHANDYIQWVIIHRACKEGYKYYDMGEATGSSNLAKFKAKWGCEKREIYHYYYPQGHNLQIDSIDFTANTDIYKKIWRRLPLPVTNNVGVAVNYFL